MDVIDERLSTADLVVAGAAYGKAQHRLSTGVATHRDAVVTPSTPDVAGATDQVVAATSTHRGATRCDDHIGSARSEDGHIVSMLDDRGGLPETGEDIRRAGRGRRR
jgi:hypothetical protein